MVGGVIRPSYVHFNYDDLETGCRCVLCERTRETKAALSVAESARGGQSFGSPTPENQAWRKAVNRHVAASNRMIAYSEMSYLLRDVPWKKTCLDWLFARTQNSKKVTDYWWLQCGVERSLGLWLEEWWEEHMGMLLSYESILRNAGWLLGSLESHLTAKAPVDRRALFARTLLKAGKERATGAFPLWLASWVTAHKMPRTASFEEAMDAWARATSGQDDAA